jgi:hypothetical protein
MLKYTYIVKDIGSLKCKILSLQYVKNIKQGQLDIKLWNFISNCLC